MGVDFLRNKRQPHKKAWNLQILRKTDDLFADGPKRPNRVFRSILQGSANLCNGSEVLIRRLSDGNVVISQDVSLVGGIDRPASDLLRALDTHNGILAGRVYECFADLGIVDIEAEL